MFNVVLVEPEIPANTGNIGRTCVLAGARLHLVGPLGFELSDKAVQRALTQDMQHPAGRDDGQTLAVRDVIIGAQGMLDGVAGPAAVTVA